ncbi:MAG TPA: hypothetical protein OIM11_02280 [Coriobacteriaceae bacterium]|nr:hypothetical protein [Coriobacteriaceae bacterium]
MTLNIDADCALAYWMFESAEAGPSKHHLRETLLDRLDIGNLPDWTYAPDECVHVVATDVREFLNRNGVLCRVAHVGLPRGSSVLSIEGLPVVSPECCFLRLAGMLSLRELVKAGDLLCSAFSFDETGCLTGRREMVTSAEKLARYVKKAGPARGVKQARRALRFLVDGAASPPEIDACLLLCLPAMQGGYGCPLPELNGHVRLRPAVARTLGYEDCYGDLLWRDAKCIVEYTSEQHHTGYQKQAQDEMRRAALEAMGYRVFLLTKPQLYNQVAFEGIARPILRVIGRRMPRQTLEYQAAQYDLRKGLLHEPSWVIKRACGGWQREF